ncbi:23S rRNA (uracil(1939)-C(5))-methyltransferase RlmD [Oceanisphaera avium]|uniref:23S rRNA (Uracil(1939)-C(5))-methyltransferase RlmD n=1 Tax=Oceanisphaera avium TaxID=1903694 RepID=A0A1Y0D0U9_9GAMM|nr:23S rRNA (uracil(1939)-C(5))-methyltransferase RlmD [Oceanisphaera avium]ART80864.1 23S rRNA (uracil(1939)-C(5))-methyltransferase RlmD [Oceanisphaera avium]
MLKPGTRVTVLIKELTDKGDGIAYLEGRPLYVAGALVNERAIVMLTQIKPNFMQGKLEQLIASDPQRQADFCIYQACGGCQLRVLGYQAQLALKQQLLIDVLHTHQLACPVASTLGMAEPFHYRNKAQYAVRPGAQIGFYAKLSHQLIDIKECVVQAPITSLVVAQLKLWMQTETVSAYNELTEQGCVRHIMIRNGINSGQVMVVLVVNELLTEHERASLLLALQNIVGLTSVMLNINKAKGNRVLGDTTHLLWGKSEIIDSLAGLKFAISAQSFYQINPKQTEALYQEALRLAAPQPQDIAFDLYCGIGTISLFLAPRVGQVYGIEVVAEAIVDAKKNAQLNGLSNLEFYTGKAEQVVPTLYSQGIKADLVIVDPPRKGCDTTLLATLVAMQPSRLVYVSCNPKSLARDLEWLTHQGFTLEQATPVDMFPHTMHVEAVVLLTWQGRK